MSTTTGGSTVTAGRTTALMLTIGIITSACSGTGPDPDAITISGSSTVEPITSLVAEAFAEANPGITISVDGPGTGDGFELFCSGDSDISDASRPIEDAEAQACADAGIEYIELTVAIDGLTVLTNPANDRVECLDAAGIYALVGPESIGFDEWADAAPLADELGSAYGDSFPGEALDVTGPGEESGTYDTFVELVIEEIADERGEDAVTRPDYQSSPNDSIIVQGIEGADTSFGWVGYAFFVGERDRLRAIPIDDGDGACVAPTEETIADGSYPLARPLFMYVNTDRAAENPDLAAFVDYYLGDAGSRAVRTAGYVELSDEEWATTGQAWADR